MLSTLLVAPTSRSSPPPRSFRPTISIDDTATQVLVEQTSAVAPERLGELVGRLSHDELVAVVDALRLVLALD